MCDIKLNFFTMDKWRIAHVLRFKFLCGLGNVQATAIYLRPFVPEDQRFDDIDNAIINAIKSEFVFDCHIVKEYCYSVEGKEDVLSVYLHGGTSLEFIVDFVPKIPISDIPLYENKTFRSPKLHFNLSLVANPDPVNIPRLYITTAELPVEHYEDYLNKICQIETL